MHLIFGVVGVAARIESVERAPVVAIKRETQLDALRQVRVRDEMAAEGDQAGITVDNGGLCRSGFEPARGDNRAVEDLAQLLRGDRALPFGDHLATLHPGLNDMEIGQLDVVESFCDVAEQSARIAIRHAVEGAARRNAHAGTRSAPQTGTSASTTSNRNRARFSIVPPYRSVRLL